MTPIQYLLMILIAMTLFYLVAILAYFGALWKRKRKRRIKRRAPDMKHQYTYLYAGERETEK